MRFLSFGGRMVRRIALLAALLAAPAPAIPQPDDRPGGSDAIRASADGAGPSHLFRLTSDSSGDTIGVVDPLFAAIRFYRIRRGDAPLAERLDPIGACALPIDFRSWRIHQFRTRIAIESMPDPGALGHGATPTGLSTRVVTIDRDLLRDPAPFRDAARRLDTRGWNPVDAPACGKIAPRESGVGTRRADRSARSSSRMIRLGNARDALAPRPSLIVRSRSNRLISAVELEPTPDWRVVQAVEALPSDDGVLRTRVRILAYARKSRGLRHAVALNDSELRGKFGQKPAAVLSSGELLLMGKQPGSGPFRIYSCGNLANPSGHRLCGEDSEPKPRPAATVRGGPDRSAVARQLTARTIFANVERLVSYRLEVDTRALPDACRDPAGCSIEGGDRFVPIRGIRLTRGIFTRRGVPYAQARVPQDLDPLFETSSAQLSRTLAQVRHGARGWPGNLRDGLEGDLGIDCSGLVQIAWGGRGGDRLDTWRLQALSSPLACPARLPGPEYMRPGDALGIRIDAPAHLANHMVLFAASMQLDGASDSWLVLESSSGCDGVCWSVYDPSYFNGWGLYRAGGRRDAPCIVRSDAQTTPMPFELGRWTRLVAGR